MYRPAGALAPNVKGSHMLNAELIVPADDHPGAVRVVARAPFEPEDWDVFANAAGIPGEMDRERLTDLTTAAALRTSAAVLWRVLDTVAALRPELASKWLAAGQRLAYLVVLLSEYPHCTLTFAHGA